jgi:hypothetical protein
MNTCNVDRLSLVVFYLKLLKELWVCRVCKVVSVKRGFVK